MRTGQDPFRGRLDRVRASLRGMDALLVSFLVNVRYLSGFTGTHAYLLIGKEKAFFITDPRYGRYAVAGMEDVFEPVIIRSGLSTALRRLARRNGVERLGFEKSSSYALYERLKSTKLRLVPVQGLVERVRMKKEPGEILHVKEAVRRAEDAFLRIKPYIKPGISELALARRLEENLRRGCFCELPFPVIVASGPANSAIPHARPTGRVLEAGDLVIFDWGSESGGYCSDMSRTFLLAGGERAAEKRRIYRLALEAQKAAIKGVADGKPAKEIDNSARYVIKQAGFGEYFTHGLGHGVGLEVHEMPGISARSKEKAANGMLFTVEPGVYVPGLGGVRIEDMVFLNRGRAEVLTSLPRDLRSNTAGGAR